MAHIILFEHTHFRGAHKRVLRAEPSLNATEDKFFNDKVSSLAVLDGNWALYRDAGLRSQAQYPLILGPGLYPRLHAVQIANDAISSLHPVTTKPGVFGTSLDNHILLFEHASFRGAHKHVFIAEPNLNAQDDNLFNDKVSSIAILSGKWFFFRDSDFRHPYEPVLRRGLYPFVGEIGIINDDISSLIPEHDG